MKLISGVVLGAAALMLVIPSRARDASAQGSNATVGPAISKAQGSAGEASKPAGPANDPEPNRAEASSATDEATEVAPNVWSEEDIARAKAHCEKVLHGVEAVLQPAEPIKEGECGAPAPVRLISIGRDPEITLSPPVTVTCDLVATLAGWVKEDLQPLAKTHLGAPIVRMSTMSSYSCRNAYGRKSTRLSEHALANAIDVGGFATSHDSKADLLTGWGLTARDLEAIVAKAKADAERRKTEARKTAARSLAEAKDTGTPGQVFLKSSADGIAPLPIRKPSLVARQWRVRLVAAGTRDKALQGKLGSGAVALNAPSHLGGPNSDGSTIVPQAFDPEDGVALFLRAAHETACKRFGTVLGPEANEAHRNHFHLDMAKRKRSNYCE